MPNVIEAKPHSIDLLSLNVHHPVNPDSLDGVGTLLREKIPDNRLVKPELLHATLINIPRAVCVFRKLREADPDVSISVVNDRFNRLVGRLLDLPASPIVGETDRFGILKTNATYFVLRLKNNGDIRWMHRLAYEGINEFLSSFGIVDIPDFMKGIPGLKFATPGIFSPHITVARNYGELKLFKTNVDGTKILLGPPRVVVENQAALPAA